MKQFKTISDFWFVDNYLFWGWFNFLILLLSIFRGSRHLKNKRGDYLWHIICFTSSQNTQGSLIRQVPWTPCLAPDQWAIPKINDTPPSKYKNPQALYLCFRVNLRILKSIQYLGNLDYYGFNSPVICLVLLCLSLPLLIFGEGERNW